MYDNIDVKDKIRGLLDEGNSTDALALFRDYSIQYRSNERQSRKITLAQVVALLAVSLRNTSNKVIVEKLGTAIVDIQQIAKM